MKKYLAILLAILMLLAALPMSAFAEEEVVTLTYLSNGNRPQNEYTDETWQYIKDNLGIDLQVTQAPENFTQQLALLVASGDIPDLIWMDYNTYVSYAEKVCSMISAIWLQTIPPSWNTSIPTAWASTAGTA